MIGPQVEGKGQRTDEETGGEPNESQAPEDSPQLDRALIGERPGDRAQ
jgi:hypothetical protein